MHHFSVVVCGGIAQLARAFGSYPECRWFESNCRYQFWPGGQEVKTPPFHGGNTSSILVRVTRATKQMSQSADQNSFDLDSDIFIF